VGGIIILGNMKVVCDELNWLFSESKFDTMTVNSEG
jgi:hypothetical protein